MDLSDDLETHAVIRTTTGCIKGCSRAACRSLCTTVIETRLTEAAEVSCKIIRATQHERGSNALYVACAIGVILSGAIDIVVMNTGTDGTSTADENYHDAWHYIALLTTRIATLLAIFLALIIRILRPSVHRRCGPYIHLCIFIILWISSDVAHYLTRSAGVSARAQDDPPYAQLLLALGAYGYICFSWRAITTCVLVLAMPSALFYYLACRYIDEGSQSSCYAYGISVLVVIGMSIFIGSAAMWRVRRVQRRAVAIAWQLAGGNPALSHSPSVDITNHQYRGVSTQVERGSVDGSDEQDLPQAFDSTTSVTRLTALPNGISALNIRMAPDAAVVATPGERIDTEVSVGGAGDSNGTCLLSRRCVEILTVAHNQTRGSCAFPRMSSITDEAYYQSVSFQANCADNRCTAAVYIVSSIGSIFWDLQLLGDAVRTFFIIARVGLCIPLAIALLVTNTWARSEGGAPPSARSGYARASKAICLLLLSVESLVAASGAALVVTHAPGIFRDGGGDTTVQGWAYVGACMRALLFAFIAFPMGVWYPTGIVTVSLLVVAIGPTLFGAALEGQPLAEPVFDSVAAGIARERGVLVLWCCAAAMQGCVMASNQGRNARVVALLRADPRWNQPQHQ
jgi:hypothetical protein